MIIHVFWKIYGRAIVAKMKENSCGNCVNDRNKREDTMHGKGFVLCLFQRRRNYLIKIIKRVQIVPQC